MDMTIGQALSGMSYVLWCMVCSLFFIALALLLSGAIVLGFIASARLLIGYVKLPVFKSRKTTKRAREVEQKKPVMARVK